MTELTGRCVQCNSEIIVDLGDNDEIWARKELTSHAYECPTCKLVGNFIECVRYNWKPTKFEHILTKTEINSGRLIIAGKQYRMFYPLMINMPDHIDVYVRKKRGRYKLSKYNKWCKFYVYHPYLKKFKPHDLISIEVANNYIRVRKI